MTATPTPDLPDTQHTPGPWRIGKNYGAIVAAVPTDGPNGCDDLEAYGGHLVCESVARKNMRLIAAAPDLFNALRSLLRHAERMAEVMDEECGIRFRDDGPVSMARDALAKAREVKP